MGRRRFEAFACNSCQAGGGNGKPCRNVGSAPASVELSVHPQRDRFEIIETSVACPRRKICMNLGIPTPGLCTRAVPFRAAPKLPEISCSNRPALLLALLKWRVTGISCGDELPREAVVFLGFRNWVISASLVSGAGISTLTKVRDLVACLPQTLQLVLGLIGSASPEQVTAVGLGQSARICVRTDQASATEIQNAVAALSKSNLTLAFSEVLVRPIGAIAGGPGSGGFSSRANGGQTTPTGPGLRGLVSGFPSFFGFVEFPECWRRA